MQDATNDQAKMTPTKLQDLLANIAFEETEDGEGLLPGIEHSMSFEDGGILTWNRGVILRFEDGTEFQLTIVQSK